jgi:hypothetical protein
MNVESKKVYGKSWLFCVYYPDDVQYLDFQMQLWDVGIYSPHCLN